MACVESSDAVGISKDDRLEIKWLQTVLGLGRQS